MDDEKLERFKEFMVQQQAQSTERIAQMEDLLVRFAQATRERLALNDQRAQELDEKFAALVDAQIRSEDMLTDTRKYSRESAADFDRKIAALVDAQMKTEETVRKLGEDARKTEEAVRRLAVTVDRHIAEGHNGRARPES